jgi:hypothetical protein
MWGLVGVLAASMLGITTDQIIQNVYDPVNTALRANVIGGSGSLSLTVGTTPITNGADTRVLFQDGTVLGEDSGLVFNKTTNAVSAGGDVTAGALGTGPGTFTADADSCVTLSGASTNVLCSDAVGGWLASELGGGYSHQLTANSTDVVTNKTFNGITFTGAVTGLTAGLVPQASSSTGLADSSSYRVSLANSGSTGTTVNKTVKLSSAGAGVIMSAGDTAGIFGIVESGAGTTGSAIVTLIGLTTCVSDNSTTTGHYAGLSSSVAGDCTDLGASFPATGVAVIGTWKETGAAAARSILFNTPDVSSVSAATNGNGNGPGVKGTGTANLIPKFSNGNTIGNSSITDNGTTISSSEILSVGALTYNGKLNIADITAENASFTIAHRIEYVTTSTSTIVATTPTSPTVGDTYTVVKVDSGNGNITWTRAGSQTLNGATTRVVSAQYAVDTCTYMASNVWICQGNGT